jgi:chromosome segregation ATPase
MTNQLLAELEMANKKIEEKDKEIERLNNKLNAIRKYLKDNEQEYGSLEDNEKIILDILNGDSND